MIEKNVENGKPRHHWGLLPDNHNLRLLLILIGLLAIGGAFYTIPSVSRALAQATTRQPEPYTELYFTNPSQLKKTFAPRTSQAIHFTIRNHEGQATSYPYAIYLDGTQITSGSVRLAPDETLPIIETIRINSTKSRLKLTVTLLNTNQSIHYWTEKEL